MASSAVKVTVLCMLLVLSVAGQLTMATAARRPIDEAALLRLQEEMEEKLLVEELALLDDGGVGISCGATCKVCLGKCLVKCIPKVPNPSSFVSCFLDCGLKCFN